MMLNLRFHIITNLLLRRGNIRLTIARENSDYGLLYVRIYTTSGGKQHRKPPVGSKDI